jgi:hypothetical protein
MSRVRVPLILLVVVLATLVRLPTVVLASCAATPQGATAIRDAPLAFIGTVTSVDNAGRVANVHVEDVWKGKGVATDVQVVGSPELGAAATSVDRTYTVGQKYLFVPFSGSGKRFEDDNCTLTQPYSAGLAAFRPSDAPGSPRLTATSSQAWFAVVGGLVVLVVFALVGITQRRRRTGMTLS